LPSAIRSGTQQRPFLFLFLFLKINLCRVPSGPALDKHCFYFFKKTLFFAECRIGWHSANIFLLFLFASKLFFTDLHFILKYMLKFGIILDIFL